MVSDMLKTFAKFSFPVLTVTSRNGATVRLSQNKFFLYPFDDDGSDATLWTVPVTSALPGSSSADVDTLWMDGETGQLDLSDASASPYLINFRQSGYYRVNYDEDNWDALATNLEMNMDNIDPLNRAQVIFFPG